MAVKLSSSLPQDVDANGMYLLHGELVKHPDRRHLVVMVVDCLRATVDHGTEDRYTPTAGVVFIEPITDGEDVDQITEIMGRVRAERTNDGTLDFDFGVGTDPFTKAAHDLRTASGVHARDEREAGS